MSPLEVYAHRVLWGGNSIFLAGFFHLIYYLLLGAREISPNGGDQKNHNKVPLVLKEFFRRLNLLFCSCFVETLKIALPENVNSLSTSQFY